MIRKSPYVKGKDVTPFMLAKVEELTGGKSLDANIALVKHNAHVDADIAAKLAEEMRLII
ncbi:hypothetical protein E4U82_09580 [Lentibacillus salicampi]|uniref:Uncharacterized protein n=1 Tax=Lentibacillus salicampi TaxID=175306 RepID=A0A4Y9AEX0_9BACI|nr:hypothetical protein E4U82_09580 [Lentibacillus salicampi]